MLLKHKNLLNFLRERKIQSTFEKKSLQPSKKAIIISFILLFFISYLSISVGSGGVNLNFIGILFSGEPNAVESLIHLRLARWLTALSTGGMLAVTGLLMQNLFRNPLAGPSVLGVSSGSALAVAIVILCGLAIYKWTIILASILGAMLVLGFVLLIYQKLKNVASVLIAGIITGYLLSAILTLLSSTANAQNLQKFVFWGFGGFNNTEMQQALLVGVFSLTIGIVLYANAKAMNVWVSGELQAQTFGLNSKKYAFFSIVISGLVVGIATAFCGPIAFIGIVVPHLAKLLLKGSNHKSLVPVTWLLGAVIAITADFIARAPWSHTELPLNAVLSLLGSPVIFYLIFKGNQRQIWN
jgi:iron complex transport system permease protein